MFQLEEDSSIFISNKIYLGIGGDDPNNMINGGILVNCKIGKIIKIIKDSREIEKIVNSNHVKVFNFTDKILMPGLIDSHVHVNEPGRTEWEGFATATKAAAAGGFTTIVDMPLNSIPPTTTVENLKTKIDCAKDQIHVDVAFWGGFIPENVKDIPDMIDYGVIGFKCFMCPSGVPEFPHVTKDDIRKVLTSIENGNSVLAFHAEIDSSCCLPEKDQISDGDPVKFETYLESRPSSFETSAVGIVLDFAKTNPKCKMHIVHLSTSDSLDMIRSVRNQCPNLTIETCHHYLCLDCNQVADGHTEFKCCPPIRDVKNRDKLWNAIKNKEIDLVVSDHSPSTADMKLLSPTSKDKGNFLKAWGGISSNQYGLSLFWTHCKKYGLGIKDMHELMCKNPSKLCGLDNRKGSIQVGFDADFCVWDPNEEFTVKQKDIRFKNKMTPYLNMKLQGVVYATVVRGMIVYKINEQFAKPVGNILLNSKIAETVL